MKILIATTSHKSAILIKGQGKYLKSKGHEVIYSCKAGFEAESLVKEENLIFEPIPFSREIHPLNDLYCLIKAVRILLKHKPDVVNAGTPKAGLIYMIASKIVGIRGGIFTLRGIRSSTLKGCKKRMVRSCEKITCLFAQKVIAISPSLKDEAIRLKLSSKKKILVLLKGSSNGVDLKKFSLTPEKVESIKRRKQQLHINENAFIVGFIGRIVKDKGVEEMVDAFYKLYENVDAKLLLVGDYEDNNPISDIYKEKIKSNSDIIEIGYSEDVSVYVALFDVIVLASYREGFGNVIIEAGAMGTPAVVSNIPGAKDTIIDGYSGILVPPKDVEKLYNALKFYSVNPGILKLYGENAKLWIHSYFSNELIWKEQEVLYEDIIGNV